MAITSQERLNRCKFRTAQRVLISSADNVRYQTNERLARSARLGLELSRPRSKAVTEERLAAVLAARRRRKGQSPGGALGDRLAQGTRAEKDKDTTGENPTRAHPPQRACGEQPPKAALSEPQADGGAGRC